MSISAFSGALFKHLPVSLDVLVNFGDQLLQEHLDMHKTVSYQFLSYHFGFC